MAKQKFVVDLETDTFFPLGNALLVEIDEQSDAQTAKDLCAIGKTSSLERLLETVERLRDIVDRFVRDALLIDD